MYLSRAVVRPEAWRNPELISLFKNSYSIHQVVWSFFLGNEEKKRDFLFRYDFLNGSPVIYILFESKPVSAHGVWVVDSKVFAPVLSKGDMLSFSVRVNPVVTKCYRDEMSGKEIHKRHDVVMNRKFEARKMGISLSHNEVVSEAGFEWLAMRGEKHGFSVSPASVLVERYEKKVFDKSAPGGKVHEVNLGTLDFRGVLEVTDVELFLDMLFHGLGPAKGFGCGLILIKRV